MEHACWAIGCVNMAVSMVFSAIGHHKESLGEKGKASIQRACNIHQLASIGFMVLAYQGAPLVPVSLLSVATILFPGVIYYQTLKDTKTFLGRFVPMGGLMHMAFWVSMAIYFRPPTPGTGLQD